ncbi:hypothetical protein M9H77_30259 [Catharanthus roseus]|uniref:Uncharacterized protein n=1 Tax=Catharanthus roseus TaxID=4058 RepID=A0ACB9ZZC8_CATRO|nr:hypothetical protein M9H77_30259 [Catharanthus roseus]
MCIGRSGRVVKEANLNTCLAWQRKKIEKYHTGTGIPIPYPGPWKVGFESKILFHEGYGSGFGSKFNYKKVAKGNNSNTNSLHFSLNVQDLTTIIMPRTKIFKNLLNSSQSNSTMQLPTQQPQQLEQPTQQPSQPNQGEQASSPRKVVGKNIYKKHKASSLDT